MSTVLRTPAQAPASIRPESGRNTHSAAERVSLRHADTPERWASALKRAQDAGVRVYELGHGRYAVTSAHDAGKAYEVTVVPEQCTCPAALGGDPVCLHRAIVREHLRPQPEPPAHAAYDPHAEALQWAHNDRDRAYRDLERYNAAIERKGNLTDSEYHGFLCAQQREQDASARIAELSAKVQVAA